ncbi:hypothetical protein ACSV5K_25525 [Agrobacterium pusense]|uniref:hypothetical protein n=1 Tax=Agrobacterium pusense TaxID=648995 RepID=UPI003FD6A9CA
MLSIGLEAYAKPARRPVEGTHHGDITGLPWRWNPLTGNASGPATRQIGMSERLALVTEEDDIACLGLPLSRLQPQADTFDSHAILAMLST